MAQLTTTIEENRNQESPPTPDDVAVEFREPALPDPEVPEQAKRRRFSAKYKLDILRQADACTEKGELGKLLRREGLYSSHLTNWRRQREEGSLKGLGPKKQGRAKKGPKSKRMAQLEGENRRLRKQLEQAETIIEIQKKVSTLFGMPMNGPKSGEND